MANWMYAEKMIASHGMLYKKGDKAENSPYIEIGANYLKQASDAWAEIYKVVRETNTREFTTRDANDEVMEAILSGRFSAGKGGKK